MTNLNLSTLPQTDAVADAFHQHIASLEAQQQTNTAAHFRTTLAQLLQFCPNAQLTFPQIDAPFLTHFEHYLQHDIGVCRNTSSCYLRTLRTIYNKYARDPLLHPFDSVYTGNDKTRKRALTLCEMRQLAHINLEGKTTWLFARDMFLFSFLCRGMSLVDMAALRQSNLRNGTLSYTRAKTGHNITVDWEDAMQRIVSRHTTTDDHLLPLTHHYKSKGEAINRNLAKIGALAGINRHFTLYCARHTWATLARDSGCNIHILKQALGHSDLRTTQIYLADLDHNKISEANRNLIQKIMN